MWWLTRLVGRRAGLRWVCCTRFCFRRLYLRYAVVTNLVTEREQRRPREEYYMLIFNVDGGGVCTVQLVCLPRYRRGWRFYRIDFAVHVSTEDSRPKSRSLDSTVPPQFSPLPSASSYKVRKPMYPNDTRSESAVAGVDDPSSSSSSSSVSPLITMGRVRLPVD